MAFSNQTQCVMSAFLCCTITTVDVDPNISQVHGGHEVMIHEAWLGATYYGTPNHTLSEAGSTAIELIGNDHVVSDVIVFGGQVREDFAFEVFFRVVFDTCSIHSLVTTLLKQSLLSFSFLWLLFFVLVFFLSC